MFVPFFIGVGYHTKSFSWIAKNTSAHIAVRGVVKSLRNVRQSWMGLLVLVLDDALGGDCYILCHVIIVVSCMSLMEY